MNGVKELIRQFVADGIRTSESLAGLLRVPMHHVVPFITGAYMESIVAWMRNGCEPDAEVMADTLLELSLYGPYLELPPMKK